jgi:nitrate reductase gamma subunit
MDVANWVFLVHFVLLYIFMLHFFFLSETDCWIRKLMIDAKNHNYSISAKMMEKIMGLHIKKRLKDHLVNKVASKTFDYQKF